MIDELKVQVAREKCELDHLFFTRYFFKARQSIKFIVNWHHRVMCDAIQGVLDGTIENLVVNVSPGASKTEIFVINLIARGLAINPRSRFLHLTGSDSLASLNSSAAREVVRSDEYQQLWPLQIADDAKAKKRWNVLVDGQIAGGVYATALGGQVTGFRAGHMAEGFQGCLILDDLIKPEDAFSPAKLESANRKLLTTVKSRKANPKTPIVMVMQRIAESDPTGFIEKGNLPGNWTVIKIPAVIDEAYVASLEPRYQALIDKSIASSQGRFSYWPYKEPLEQLLTMEQGAGSDQSGQRISRHVFSSQYQQAPNALGGNIIKGDYFHRYITHPPIKWRKIFADTAMKTGERNDFSVFAEWGVGTDGKLYLLDMIRGKWEAPELQKRAVAFWAACRNKDIEVYGQLRKMVVEDKASGTGLIQSIRLLNAIPIEPIERTKDKFTRCGDALPYIEAGLVCVPVNALFTNNFIAECESFTADDTHDHDDMVDTCFDACMDFLAAGNKMKQWERLAMSEV